MKMPKITKVLPIALALALSTTGVFADAGMSTEESPDTQTATYELNLDTFFDVELTTKPVKSEVSFTNNYTTATIDQPLQGVFQVISNTTEKDIYLYGECQAGGPQSALYGSVGDMKLIFTNETVASTAEAIESVKSGTDSFNNPNAIAFKLAINPTHEETPLNGFNTEEFVDDNLHYNIANGKHTFECIVSGSAVEKTFSTMDNNGLYKATLTMSDTKL